jgi:hypothetical protein
LTLPGLSSLSTRVHSARLVAAADALAQGRWLLLLEALGALVEITGKAQHLVQEISLLLLIAVDLTAEVLYDLALVPIALVLKTSYAA